MLIGASEASGALLGATQGFHRPRSRARGLPPTSSASTPRSGSQRTAEPIARLTIVRCDAIHQPLMNYCPSHALSSCSLQQPETDTRPSHAMAYALHEQASQETLVSLLQLDPAPIESPYAEDEKDLQFSPEDDAEHTKPTTAGSPTPLGLSRSNSHASHNSIYYRMDLAFAPETPPPL